MKSLGKYRGSFNTTYIRTDYYSFFYALFTKIFGYYGNCRHMIHRDIKKSLYGGGMKVYKYSPIDTGNHQ